MIVSLHLAKVGRLRAQELLFAGINPRTVHGMTYAETALTAPLSKRVPRPHLDQIALVAAWDDDVALDRFLDRHTFAQQLAGGWHVRLEPRRCFGHWAGMPDLPTNELTMDDEEPVAVLTLGRLRLLRARDFLRSAAPAERDAVADPALVASTGLARPARPRLVSTFSIWRSVAEMRRYAFDSAGTHQAAVRTDRARSFHHESAFIRFRPYASRGDWDGGDPVATL